MIILMVGPQGCGKGTQGEKLSEYLNIPLITVGQLLRDVPVGHPQYEELHKLMDVGELAPYQMTANIIKNRVLQDDCNNGYILDGWARNINQFDYFYPSFDKVIYLGIPREISIERLSGRLSCPKCTAVFNVLTVPPKVENICDFCGTELYTRSDDTQEAISERLDIFYNETREVIEFFEEKGILLKIDARPMPDEVFEKIKQALQI